MAFGPKVNPIGTATPFGRGDDPSLERVIVPPVAYPTKGKAPTLGGALGRAPFTPQPLVDRAVASDPVGRFRLTPGTFIAGSQWRKLDVERPTIVQALSVDTPLEVVQDVQGPQIRYNYGKIPDNDEEAQLSQSCGTCFLSNPGTWWLKAIQRDLEEGYAIDCIVIDASHPEVARRFLDQPMIDYCLEANVDLSDNTVATAVPFGRYCRAVTVQNVPPAAGGAGEVVRYVVGQPSAYLVAAGAWTGVGFRLLVNGSVTFSGKALNGFGLYAVSESATDAALEVVRYMD